MNCRPILKTIEKSRQFVLCLLPSVSLFYIGLDLPITPRLGPPKSVFVNMLGNHPESCGCSSSPNGFRLSELTSRVREESFANATITLLCFSDQFKKYQNAFELLKQGGSLVVLTPGNTTVHSSEKIDLKSGDLRIAVSDRNVQVTNGHWTAQLKPGEAIEYADSTYSALKQSISKAKDPGVLSVVSDVDLANLSVYGKYERTAERNLSSQDRSCVNCHQKEVEAHENTRHSRALSSLSDNPKADKSCLPCHSTEAQNPGFDYKSFPSQSITCASCHGDLSVHGLTGGKSGLRPVEEKACKSCHTTETDVSFDFLRKRVLVNHVSQ